MLFALNVHIMLHGYYGSFVEDAVKPEFARMMQVFAYATILLMGYAASFDYKIWKREFPYQRDYLRMKSNMLAVLNDLDSAISEAQAGRSITEVANHEQRLLIQDLIAQMDVVESLRSKEAVLKSDGDAAKAYVGLQGLVQRF